MPACGHRREFAATHWRAKRPARRSQPCRKAAAARRRKAHCHAPPRARVREAAHGSRASRHNPHSKYRSYYRAGIADRRHGGRGPLRRGTPKRPRRRRPPGRFARELKTTRRKNLRRPLSRMNKRASRYCESFEVCSVTVIPCALSIGIATERMKINETISARPDSAKPAIAKRWPACSGFL